MRTGVPPRVRIDADQPQLANLDASLLGKLAPAGRLHRLANIDEASREGVAAHVRWSAAADEEDTAFAVEHGAVHRAQGRPGLRHPVRASEFVRDIIARMGGGGRLLAGRRNTRLAAREGFQSVWRPRSCRGSADWA